MNRRKLYGPDGNDARYQCGRAAVMPFPLSAVDTSAARALSGLSEWDAVRAQFNLAPNKINMSCYWQASHPKAGRVRK